MKQLYCTLLLLALSGAYLYAESGVDALEQMTSTNLVKRQQASQFLIQQQKEFEKKLTSIVDGAFPKEIIFDAAKVLGQNKSETAAASLAKKIGLDVQGRSLMTLITDEEVHPISTALVKIGIPSIPAVIRNLAESDDAKVRELSLEVLYRIERDKDIVQLRLQKALAAEKDLQKQARLQSALKALAEISLRFSGQL